MLGDDFSLVDCAFGPVLNALEKARFSFADFPKVRTYLEAFRSRPSWQATPPPPHALASSRSGKVWLQAPRGLSAN